MFTNDATFFCSESCGNVGLHKHTRLQELFMNFSASLNNTIEEFYLTKTRLQFNLQLLEMREEICSSQNVMVSLI